MRAFEKYVKNDFKSYEDFSQNFKLNAPDDFNFAYDIMDDLAERHPNKRAMLWTDVEGNVKEFTFLDFKKLSNKAVNFFTSLGIKKGDMVMLILKRQYEFWISILALHKIGAVAIPATHLLTKKDIVYRNNAASIKAIICTDKSEVEEHIEDAEAESPTLELKILVGKPREGWVNFWEGMDKASDVWERPTDERRTMLKDPMLMYFTSGTTGMPKMVVHDYSYALGHIITAVFWHNVDPDGIHLSVSDSGWGKCAWGKLYGQWAAETCVFVYDFDKFVPHEMLEVISKFKITTFCAPPTIYRYFIKEDLSKYDLSSLKYATTAGEALNPEVFEQFKQATGLNIMEAFGQTETVLVLGNFIWMKSKPGSLGKPNPIYNVDIVDDEGNSCKTGEVGEIAIRTGDEKQPLGMFMGYYRDEELTREAWHDGIYRTGDVAWRDEEGYYWYVSRADDVIKSSGYRIGPFEVESALMEHPAVLETAITGVPHPDRGQIIKATIVLAKGYEPSEALIKELQDHVKRTTAPYKYPRVIEFVEELPKTISGKIRRVEIREKSEK